MTANSLRGEVTITLEGVDYVLRPTFTAITAIEDQTGKSLLQLAIASDAGQMSTREMAVVVTETMRAAAEDTNVVSLRGVKTERVAELLFEAGLLAVQPRVALVLAQALTGGHKHEEPGSGEAKAARKRPKKATIPAAS